MTKLSKLYDRLRSSSGGGNFSFRDFEKLLRAFGFEHDRTVGSHRQYVHPSVPRPFPVQPAGKDAKRYQLRDFLELIDRYALQITE